MNEHHERPLELDDTLEDKLRRISDVLGFLDFAFPGACNMELEAYDVCDTLTMTITNILPSTFDELILPRLRGEETLVYNLDKEKELLTLKFPFEVDEWPRILPLMFVTISHDHPSKVTPTHVGTLLKQIADGEITSKEYQAWMNANMTDESSIISDD